MNGYYPDWSAWYLAPEDVDFTKFDVIDFAFALPTADNGLQFTQDTSSDSLRRLVTTAHAAGKKVKLSIGGWTGSQYFSTIVSQSWSTTAFVNNILEAYHEYDLDGIDIDWEYPGVQGAPGNAVSPNDAANFLNFLQILRATLPSDALISLATQVWPFAGPDGNPLSDVSGFADVIDWILIMNYDIWGSSSTPGANAPLSNGCGNSSQPLANAYSAVASWEAAGMPANKITLGVPAYGYLQMSWATRLQDRSLPHKEYAARDYLTIQNDNGGTADGQVMFESLISQGALVLDSAGDYVGGGGFFRVWDECSSTPFLKSWDSGQIVTYDDPQSVSLKGQFAAQAGIKGCNIFSIDGDWTGSSWPLTDAVRSGMGLD
ncbi:glycoside hydrolase superfamily [Kockovaella imperatae]|uniref:Glycoside hydrolase superfamily n=1 Tax=Kockovaella imperatae TaxID=4999 RepID=A0A1Y1UR57_9TREE|nr:glycoside hydrolase superfamily [Kockovaella imperatae]ORX40551.1 glycoside hydrolase superfamily [Kockovaella imperatae]